MALLDIPSPTRRSSSLIHKGRPAAEEVLQAFNTWAYKREQPSCPLLLREFIARAIDGHAPLSFVLYWGKGPRNHVAQPELDCLGYLASFAERIARRHQPGAQLNVILTDTHAGLNGHAPSAMAAYFDAVRGAADPAVFRFHLLSNVVQTQRNAILPVEQPTDAVLTQLTASASKWYSGPEAPAQAAAKYFALNMREKRAVARVFPTSVFCTFNGSDCRILFPDELPIFYMYSLRKGTSVKPWFLD